MNQSLYHILEEHKSVLQDIEKADGELTPEIEQSLQLTQERFEIKAASYGYVIKQFEDEGELIEKEIKRLQSLKSQAERKSTWLRSKISEAMQMFGVTEVKLNNIRLSFRKSKSVVIEDETKIPDSYKRTIPERHEPDKPAIKAAIETGAVIPGASLVEKENLQIK